MKEVLDVCQINRVKNSHVLLTNVEPVLDVCQINRVKNLDEKLFARFMVLDVYQIIKRVKKRGVIRGCFRCILGSQVKKSSYQMTTNFYAYGKSNGVMKQNH